MSRLSFFHPQFARPQRTRVTRTDMIIARFDTATTRLLLIVGIIFCGATYIFLVNSSATMGFRISTLQNEVATLDQEYKQLLVAKTQAESIAELYTYVEETGLTPITNRAYVDSTDRAVALMQE